MSKMPLFYFAYGSNMSVRRLKDRLPAASPRDVAHLHEHELRFHKTGRDGSGKCDAHETGDSRHAVIGIVYKISQADILILDKIEGIGVGYERKTVSLSSQSMGSIKAFTYYATSTDSSLLPFQWYKHHVMVGAREHNLPTAYIDAINNVQSMADPDQERHRHEIRIYSGLDLFGFNKTEN